MREPYPLVTAVKQIQQTAVQKAALGAVARSASAEAAAAAAAAAKSAAAAAASASPEELYGLKLVNVPGDGSCLYHAVALHTAGMDAASLRNLVADRLGIGGIDSYLREYIDGKTDEDKDKYIDSIREGIAWGDDVETKVLSRMLGKPIIVLTDDGSIRNRTSIEEGSSKEPLFVHFRPGDGKVAAHYDGYVSQCPIKARVILTLKDTPKSKPEKTCTLM